LNHQDVFKEIIVNGSLDPDTELQWWEMEPSERQMALAALKKAIWKLVQVSDCS